MKTDKNRPEDIDQIMRILDAGVEFPFDPIQWEKLSANLDQPQKAEAMSDKTPLIGKAVKGWILPGVSLMLLFMTALWLGSPDTREDTIQSSDSLQIQHLIQPEQSRSSSAIKDGPQWYPEPSKPAMPMEQVEKQGNEEYSEDSKELNTQETSKDDSRVIEESERIREELIFETKKPEEKKEVVPDSIAKRKKRHIIW